MRRLGWGPWEKDLLSRHLADGPPVPSGTAWHEAALKEVGGHASCWSKYGPSLPQGRRADTTMERWRQIHDLLDQGVGLLACARRLDVSLNTVNRYARAAEPDRMVRAPVYRSS